MVMKASLQLKMGQSLTMTPQLQQAIRLLQLSTLDLQQEIQEALDSNPMLEVEENEHDGLNDLSLPTLPQDHGTEELSYASEATDLPDLDEHWSQQQLPDELPTDSDWE